MQAVIYPEGGIQYHIDHFNAIKKSINYFFKSEDDKILGKFFIELIHSFMHQFINSYTHSLIHFKLLGT